MNRLVLQKMAAAAASIAASIEACTQNSKTVRKKNLGTQTHLSMSLERCESACADEDLEFCLRDTKSEGFRKGVSVNGVFVLPHLLLMCLDE